MPVEYEKFEDDKIIVVHYIGALTAEDLDEAVLNNVIPFIKGYAPENAHVIYDVLRLDVEFPEFIKYINIAGKRREQGLIPANLVQHFVGSNAWATNFRTWIYRKFGLTISTFGKLDDALMYIRDQNLKDAKPEKHNTEEDKA